MKGLFDGGGLDFFSGKFQHLALWPLCSFPGNGQATWIIVGTQVVISPTTIASMFECALDGLTMRKDWEKSYEEKY